MPKLLSHPFTFAFTSSTHSNHSKPSIFLLSSFIGFFDIKLGVTIISLLALLNKVAGIYGVLAVFTGVSLAQLSMYIYSILTIGLVIYGLQATGEENARKTFIYANSLLVDHLLSTVYTVWFGLSWYFDNPHDGRRIAHGDAQKNMMNPDAPELSPELRKQAAQAIWKAERDFATMILVSLWILKLYFIFVVYSFAIHLGRGTYTSLPLSKPPSTIQTNQRRLQSNLNQSQSGNDSNEIEHHLLLPISETHLYHHHNTSLTLDELDSNLV
ncbi:uncharacterized protein MELLADRAFT_117555 [Melampsora larici-populina 98AG31]|uniref:DUF1753-domain-containing protein n=1 Tax=Melampsora larici-populina (strain 98AG31 / pathotype 3-4-7) TaxID=747676 RepID=F4RYQ3_MELLP|nr:uncharacterized protein MELLADRAFT_117555 [Melampsora larici-populina 98AG31]EGG02536.1 hypothetical protein MELLADRAFT_117555 [Melampsora larici-populina 98AG31]